MRITLTSILAATALSLVMSGCASAPGGMSGHRTGMQHEAGMMHEGGMMMSMGPMVGCPGATESVDVRLASLHTSLGITAAQEALWATYAAAYRRSASSMGMGAMGSVGAMAMGSMESMRAMPLPERLQHHDTMMSSHLTALHDIGAAIAPLYASLSAEQKTAADSMSCDRPMPARS